MHCLLSTHLYSQLRISRAVGAVGGARAEDAFVQRIKRIRKELGWRSVGGDK